MKKKISLKPEPMKWEMRLGLAMIISMIISGLALGIGAAGIYAAATTPAKTVVKKLPKLKKIVIPKAAPKTSVQKQLDSIKVNLPALGVSASPMPDLKLAPLNLAIPNVPAKSVMKNFSVDKNVSYNEPVNVPVPDVTSMMQSEMGGTPPTTPPATTPPATTPTTPSANPPAGGGGNASTPNATNCAQFSGVPACSYVGDPNGQTLCNACRAAGM